MNVIDRFSGEYRFLSNFFIEPDGTHVEGEFQASKNSHGRSLTNLRHEWGRKFTPGQSKKRGRLVSLRPDWEQVKIPVMKSLVLMKFCDHPELRVELLSTGGVELVEGNNWGDRFWGVCNGVGHNHLGRILMEVRNELRTNGTD